LIQGRDELDYLVSSPYNQRVQPLQLQPQYPEDSGGQYPNEQYSPQSSTASQPDPYEAARVSMARTRGFGQSSGGGEETFNWGNMGGKSNVSSYGKSVINALVSPQRQPQQQLWQENVSLNVNALVSPPRRWQPQPQPQQFQQYQPPIPAALQPDPYEATRVLMARTRGFGRSSGGGEESYNWSGNRDDSQQQQFWQDQETSQVAKICMPQPSPSSVMSHRAIAAKQAGFGRSSGGGETSFDWSRLGVDQQSPFVGYTRPNHQYGKGYCM
jgi:hypothetical protein